MQWPDIHHPHPGPHPTQLSNNWLIATGQVITWLLLRPQIWRQHLAQASLRPNFCLAELTAIQRRQTIVRQLCCFEFLVLPLLLSALIAVILILSGQSISHIMFGVLVGFSACLSASILGGLVVSIAASWIAAIVGGLLGGIIFGCLGPTGLIGFRTDFAFAQGSLSVMIATIALPIVMSSVPNGFAASIATSVETDTPNHALGQRIGGIGLGILGSAFTLSLGLGLIQLMRLIPFSALPISIDASSRFAFGMLLSILLGLIFVRYTGKWWRDISINLMIGIISSVIISILANPTNGAVRGLAVGSGNALLLTMLFALAYNLTVGIAGVQAAVIAGTFGSSAVYTIAVCAVSPYPLWYALAVTIVCLVFSLTLTQWLPMLIYPFEQAWNSVLYRLDAQQANSQRFQRHYLLRHSVFWDEHQRLLLWGLDQHLVLMVEQVPDVGNWAIAAVSTTKQRWAARAAQIELDARQIEQCADFGAIAALHQQFTLAELADAATDILRQFIRISRDAAAVLNQSSLYNQRLLLSNLIEHLTGLGRELNRSDQLNATRFRPAQQSWLKLAEDYQQSLTKQATATQEIESPYIVGIPLNQQQEIFVGRQDISAQIERLLRDRRYSSLLLYGQRRMGKTSLLNHLGRLLPSNIVPFFIDLQGPATTASEHIGLLYNLAKGIVQSAQQYRQIELKLLTREQLTIDPFTVFDEWIDQVEAAIAPATALLMLDEFEALAQALERQRFDADMVLGMLRNLIQHRDRFRILLAGTHTLEEFQKWSGYLINLQVLHLSYLNEPEARQLIEQPVEDFSLRYEPEAVDRIIWLTNGHPFLVQLLCTEVIALKNEQTPAERRLVTISDVDAAIPEALTSGSFFFADIERNQLADAAVVILRKLADGQTDVTYTDGALIQQLIQQELLETENESYKFQVELVRQWFARSPVP